MWIEKNKDQGTPLRTWYARYKVMREREIMMEASNKDNVSYFTKLIFRIVAIISKIFNSDRFPRIKSRLSQSRQKHDQTRRKRSKSERSSASCLSTSMLMMMNLILSLLTSCQTRYANQFILLLVFLFMINSSYFNFKKKATTK